MSTERAKRIPTLSVEAVVGRLHPAATAAAALAPPSGVGPQQRRGVAPARGTAARPGQETPHALSDRAATGHGKEGGSTVSKTPKRDDDGVKKTRTAIQPADAAAALKPTVVAFGRRVEAIMAKPAPSGPRK